MYRLNTLGTLEFAGLDPAEAGAILAQPKRVAVLLYLALAQPAGWHRRDTLLGLLWGDLHESRARNALSQALHHLRRGLGADTLPGQGADLVRVDPERLGADAALFEVAARDGRHAEALALYRGDLAPGLFVEDATEFEHWLEGERRRLRDLAFDCAVALAATRESAGDPAGAAAAFRRAVVFHPEDEGTLRRLMQVLDQVGDRGSALRAYEESAARLRADLDVDPSPETQALVRRLRQPAAALTPASAAPAASVLPAGATRTPTPPETRRRFPLTLVLLAGLVVLLGIAGRMGFAGGHPSADPAGGHGVLAVAPFRLAGADPSLAYLREGMVDLLAAKLSGGDGPHALDPRTVLAAWRDAGGSRQADLTPEDALLVAGRLGADRVLLGGVMGRHDRVIINVSLWAVQGGAELARAGVDGPADSLPELVDRLATQLLLHEAGERSDRFAAMATSSLPALQAFLAGRKSYRAAGYGEAADHFRQALDYDSTFALAALHLADAMDWIGGPGEADAKNHAFALRNRLSPSDRVYLLAVLGPAFPGISSPRERLQEWERAVQRTPDRPEAWFGLGDVLHHDGAAMGEPEAVTRAREAFEHALALDPQYAAPLAHLADQAFVRDDRAAARGLVTRYLQVDSAGDLAQYLRWRLAAATDDRRMLAQLRARFDSLPPIALFRIAVASQLDGVRLADGRIAAARLLARAATPGEADRAERLRLLLALNAGRFHEAARLWPRGRRPEVTLYLAHHFWDGDTVGQRALGKRLALDAPYARYVALISRMGVGEVVPEAELEGVRRILRSEEQGWAARAEIELDALAACRTASAGVSPAVDRLDSLVLAGEEGDWFWHRPLLLARCLEWRGDAQDALRVLRRRPYRAWEGLPYLAASFKEEGRLALALRDTAGARVAWRRYLELRADPDPELVQERDRIRGLLARLNR